jgi:hypothetical protein
MEGSLVAYKVFTNGSVLNASEMNEYLMNQSVITFSNSTARGSAITTPVEGMITYLEDTQTYESWDGAAWVALITPIPSGNAIINGAFDIWQRGTSFDKTTAGTYSSADRVRTSTDTGLPTAWTHTQQSFTPGEIASLGYESQFYLRSTLTTVGVSTAVRNQIVVENVRTLAGQTVTLSFFAKSNSARTQNVSLVQVFGAGSPNSLRTATQSFNLTTSWQRFTRTFVLPDLTGRTLTKNSWLGVEFNHDLVDGSVLDLWGVQLEAGSTATPFRRNANSLQGELAACQRYYIRWGDGTQSFPLVAPSGIVAQTTEASGFINLPSRMRAVSSVEFSNLRIQDVNLNNFSVTGVSLATSNFGGNTITVNFISSGMTTGRYCRVLGDDSTSAFLAISGEL